MSDRIVRFTLEMDLVEGKHFAPMTKEATTQQIIDEAKGYLYPFLKDIIAGGEIDEWSQVKLIVVQEDNN